MCINFRALNTVIKKNRYSLLRIQKNLDTIKKARVLSKFDFTQGYYQMLLASDSREKTAFNTRKDKF
jgi:hypothetical protein